jgi:hypothetical protein
MIAMRIPLKLFLHRDRVPTPFINKPVPERRSRGRGMTAIMRLAAKFKALCPKSSVVIVVLAGLVHVAKFCNDRQDLLSTE